MRILANAPFIIYCDFKCVLIPSTGIIDSSPNAKKYHDHIVCSYGYKLTCADKRDSKPYKTYFCKYFIGNFFNDMMKGSENCFKETETTFNKAFVMTGKDKKGFKILLNVMFVKRHMKKVKLKSKILL